MNKLPTRQILLLTIFVLSVIAVSAYSTYAIFTLESETSDIVSIHTPNSLNVLTDTYEYKKITVSKNSYITTDIDIYNNLDTNVCYSVWYKVVDDTNVDTNKIKIYQNSESLSTTGILDKVNSKRISLIILNDNDTDVTINIGLAHTMNHETCELNISTDKLSITSNIDNPKILSEELIKNPTVNTNSEGYLIYEKNLPEITLEDNDKIYIAEAFEYTNESFALTEPKYIEKTKLNETMEANKVYYTCLKESNCKYLLEIVSVDINNNIKTYKKYIGYQGGDTGLKKISKDNIDNYVYFGDNPDNYIYYNCKNYLDKNTCELWRIIGFTYDEDTNTYLTKIIRNDELKLMSYSNNNNLFATSLINKYLSEEAKIDTSYLKEITYKETIVNNLDASLNNITYHDKEIKSNYTIMTLLDYLNASVCTKDTYSEYTNECLTNNWLNKDIEEWTSTIKTEEIIPSSEPEGEDEIVPITNKVYTVGNEIKEESIDSNLSLRPVVYLNQHTFLMSGTGSFDDPYMIK